MIAAIKTFLSRLLPHTLPLAAPRKPGVCDYYYNARTFAQIKNDFNTAKWRLRMAANNGHDLIDVRDDISYRRYLLIQRRRSEIQFFVKKCVAKIKARQRRQDALLEKSMPMFFKRQAN